MNVTASNRAIGKRTMDRLRENVGRNATVEYVFLGHKKEDTGILREVSNFSHVTIDLSAKMEALGTIPFVGLNVAIRTVSVGGKVLYDNRKNVPEDLRMRTAEQSREVAEASFGADAVQRVREDHLRDHPGAPQPEKQKENSVLAFLKRQW